MQRRWIQCAAAVLLLSCAFAATAATFTVTSSDDSGPGTLRQAILDANATPGRDQIVFQSHSGPTSPLPSITDAVDIDGTLNDFTAQISGFATSAFRFSAGSSTSTLRNVRVSNFSESVRIESGVSGVTITRGDFDNSFLVFGNDNVIGALAAGEGNRIEFLSVIGQSNDFFGNRIVDVQITGASNVLQGNTTGYIRILGGDDSRVGPGNATGPISLEFSSGSIVEGNTVSSSDIYGIFVRDSSVPANIRIASNTINGGTAGVVVTTLLAPAAGVEITRNAIRNVTIPIDLGNDGSTPNDPAPDADAGPNNLQNFPLLTSATLQAGTLEVQGSLTSAPLTSYRIEIFSSPAADPEAHTFLGSFTVSTDATGNVAFTQTISASPSPDDVVTSTATSLLTNDTSEVSAPVAIAAPGALGFATAAQSVDENAGTVTIVVTRTGGSDGTVTVNYATANGTAVAPLDYTATSGTLTFGPGVTEQTIVVPIANDAVPEANETFTVTLSGPTGGATLGVATTTITIVDTDLAAAAVPTASTWALIAMALGLAFVALRR